MSRAAPAYYIRLDTFWQGSPDRWVGPFSSRAEAEAEIARVADEPESLIALPGRAAADVRHGIRVYGVFSRSAAQRESLRDYSLGDERSNLLGKRLPATTDELFDMEEDGDE